MWWASASIMYGFVTSGGSSALRVLYTEDGGPDELAQTSLYVKFLIGKPSQFFCYFILFYFFCCCGMCEASTKVSGCDDFHQLIFQYLSV